MRAVAGGGSAVFAVQAASLKGEDKFIAEPDVRRSTSATARKRRGAETSSDLWRVSVFDGHVNASASSHAERRMLPALLECGANEPEAPSRRRVSPRSSRSSDPSSAADVRRVLLEVRRRPQGRNHGASCSSISVAAQPDPTSTSSPRTRRQRRAPLKNAAMNNDPPPSDDDAPASFTRPSRDHNPDDPLEAVRLANAGARLGRMRQGGEEVGPARSTGGLAVSRAIGDFDPPPSSASWR